jgi:GxxExxY protein
MTVRQQHNVEVRYDGIVVGAYSADLLVEHTVLVGLKATKAPEPIHNPQFLNYIKASGLPLCLLLNFGNSRLEIKRFANGL